MVDNDRRTDDEKGQVTEAGNLPILQAHTCEPSAQVS